MTDDQRRSHAISQLRAARELYSETGESVYLAVIDTHLRTITEVDEKRQLAQSRRALLLQELKAREDAKRVVEKTDWGVITKSE